MPGSQTWSGLSNDAAVRSNVASSKSQLGELLFQISFAAFSTVRLRQRVTRGAGSRNHGLMMAFKLLETAQRRWRRLNGSELLPLVRAGVLFRDGQQVERTDHQVEQEAAEVAA